MADSDDEFDRRRRDKFARERNDYRSDRRDAYDRLDSYSRGGRDYGSRGGDYDRRRGAYSPLRGARGDLSPLPSGKRARYESDSLPPVPTIVGGGPSGLGGAPSSSLNQPVMLTFKQFLASQDDAIDDQDAVKKYADYKADFKRRQLEEFFVTHKDEEWFRLKYHPDDSTKRKEEIRSNIEKRLEVHQKVQQMGLLDKVGLDVEKSDAIVRIMDTVAILLEGGSDEDLKVLDEPEPEIGPHTLEPVRDFPKKEQTDDASKVRENSIVSNADEKKIKDEDDSGMSDNEAEDHTGNKKQEREEAPEGMLKKGDSESLQVEEAGAEAGVSSKAEDSAVDPLKVEKEVTKDPSTEGIESKKSPVTEPNKQSDLTQKKSRFLHRTSSIFLRTLSAAITKQEVEAMCRNYPGFLRVALADPQPERKFLRRGWITFERHVNTKEICWKLNNIRLRDTELGAILNRDLSRRVRSVNGIVSAKSVMKSDIKLATKVVQNLDTQRNLWMKPGDLESKNPLVSGITEYLIEEASAEEEELLGQNTGGSNADDEANRSDGPVSLDKDPELTKVLDRLLWYLRIVHSIDYYSHSEYHNEDEMPNRCGIIHARGSMPTSQVTQNEIDEYILQFEQKIVAYSEPLRALSKEESQKLGMKSESDEIEKFMNANCQELAKDKFLCPLSGKKFKAPEFVHKHILNRHAEKLEEVKKNVMYYNNYINDPKRPMLPEHPANKSRSGPGPSGQGGSGGVGDSNGAGILSGSGGLYGAYGHTAPYSAYPPPRPGYGAPHGVYGGLLRGYGPPLDHNPYGVSGPRYGNKRGPQFSGMLRGVRDPRPVVGYHDLDTPPDFDRL